MNGVRDALQELVDSHDRMQLMIRSTDEQNGQEFAALADGYGLLWDNARAALSKQEAATPAFADPQVQLVYQMLCLDEGPPDKSEHWEGWIARRIVAALKAAPQEPAEPVAHYGARSGGKAVKFPSPNLQQRGIEYAEKAGYRTDEANFHRVFYAYCAGFTDGQTQSVADAQDAGRDVKRRLREQAAHMRENAKNLSRWPDAEGEARARELAASYVEEIANVMDMDEKVAAMVLDVTKCDPKGKE
jgi:hypothetical protein